MGGGVATTKIDRGGGGGRPRRDIEGGSPHGRDCGWGELLEGDIGDRLASSTHTYKLAYYL